MTRQTLARCLFALRKIAIERSESGTIRDMVTAPIIADSADKASDFTTSGFAERAYELA